MIPPATRNWLYQPVCPVRWAAHAPARIDPRLAACIDFDQPGSWLAVSTMVVRSGFWKRDGSCWAQTGGDETRPPLQGAENEVMAPHGESAGERRRDAPGSARGAQMQGRFLLGLGRLGDDDLLFGRVDGSPYPRATLSRDWWRVVKPFDLPRSGFTRCGIPTRRRLLPMAALGASCPLPRTSAQVGSPQASTRSCRRVRRVPGPNAPGRRGETVHRNGLAPGFWECSGKPRR